MGDFYGTGTEIWAGFGPVFATFEASFFTFSWAKKNKSKFLFESF